MENYIEKLHARNIGKFNSLNIEFNKKFNFIIGANGCGKTSVIKCLAIILNPSLALNFRYKDDCEIWADCICDDVPLRIGLGQGWVSNGDIYRNANHISWTNPPIIDGRKSLNINKVRDVNINFVPLILGAYRRIEYKNIQGMTRERNIIDKRNEYRTNSITSIDGGYLPDVKQWMINRYFEIEKDWAIKYKENWNWILNNLKYVSPFGDDFSFKEIRQDLEPIFILSDQECYLEELSAGFQAVLSLILGIVEWIETVNEENRMLIKDAVGTVLIDELDVHLHPEWQLIIRDTLDKIFPNLQFIITTHSPHLIASANKGELIKLPSSEKNVTVEPIDKSYGGWNTDQILEDIMEVKNLENKDYAKLIKDAMNFIEQKDIIKLHELIQELDKIVHPNDTIINVLKIKEASMQFEE